MKVQMNTNGFSFTYQTFFQLLEISLVWFCRNLTVVVNMANKQSTIKTYICHLANCKYKQTISKFFPLTLSVLF